MLMRKLLLFISIMTMASARAQQDPALAHYWAAQSFYNPAATALDGMLDVRLGYAMQMSGFTHAPATMTAQADLPLFFISNDHTAGILFINDKLGLFTHTKIALSYAYHKHWGRGLLSGGVRLGLLQEGFDGSKLDLIDTSDPAFPTTSQDGTGFDIDVGLRYDYKSIWYAGVSMQHLTAPSVSLGEEDQYEYNLASTFYVMGGWNRKLSQTTSLYADAMLRTDLIAWRGDITARLDYKGDRWNMYGGLGFSPTNSVTVLLGTRFQDINIGYAYEVYTSAIGALHGSHEITLAYQMDLSRFRKGRNLHKSVRLL